MRLFWHFVVFVECHKLTGLRLFKFLPKWFYFILFILCIVWRRRTLNLELRSHLKPNFHNPFITFWNGFFFCPKYGNLILFYMVFNSTWFFFIYIIIFFLDHVSVWELLLNYYVFIGVLMIKFYWYRMMVFFYFGFFVWSLILFWIFL